MQDTKAPKDGSAEPDWAPDLFAALGLDSSASTEEVYEQTDDLATRLAPDTRRLWRWILFLEGLAVLVPVFWLAAPRLGISFGLIASCAVLTTLLVIGVCWWLRWHAMRRTWGRARLVSEIARSALATSAWLGEPTRKALEGSPSLLPLVDRVGSAQKGATEAPLETRRASYLTERIEDQASYYGREREMALAARKRIGRMITRSLDAALFLAVAGLTLGLTLSDPQWAEYSHAEVFLGIFGAALPLMALIYQSFASHMQLDRRAGHYRQMEELLGAQAERFAASTSAGDARSVVADVERALLGEVTAWHYQMESAETWYRSKEGAGDTFQAAPRAGGWVSRVLGGIGWSLGFVARVLIGRGLVIALSVVLTTAVFGLLFSTDPAEQNRLDPDSAVLLASGNPRATWVPTKHADVGLIVIVHGLRSSAVSTDSTETSWMDEMREAIEIRCTPQPPNICLVHWASSANPWKRIWRGDDESGKEAPPASLGHATLAYDVAAIKPTAKSIGALLGFRLAMALKAHEIREDRPIHLIGHSAGGFVVTHAALVLHLLEVAPKDNLLRVTLLDTPVPPKDELEDVAEFAQVEFVETSKFAVAPDFEHGNYEVVKEPPPSDEYDAWFGAHTYAHIWYADTIKDAKRTKGFAKSPFAVR